MKEIIIEILSSVLSYLKADWWILLLGTLIAVSIKVFVDEKKFAKTIEKNKSISIIGSIGFGAFTPLCACGTMAVLLAMFASSLPWGAVMAFLVSSPITSPSAFLFQSSFFGTEFAVFVLVCSIVLGLSAGLIAQTLDRRTNFFKDQFRFFKKNCGCSGKKDNTCDVKKKSKLKVLLKEFYQLGIKRILMLFIVFIAVGKIVEMIIPETLILSLFGQDNIYSIPLGATLGLPLYIAGPSALPLLQTLMNQGASQGAILAFLIAGKATGVPVIAGMATIMKKKALAFYVLFVYLGGMISGFAYQLYLSF